MGLRMPKLGGVLGGLAGLGAAQWAMTDLVGPLAEGIKGELWGEQGDREQIGAIMAQDRHKQEAMYRRQELARLVESNTRRLASWSPELYNQVLAGRRLPRGSVVIGGVPRTDLLAQVAMQMAMGGQEG